MLTLFVPYAYESMCKDEYEFIHIDLRVHIFSNVHRYILYKYSNIHISHIYIQDTSIIRVLICFHVSMRQTYMVLIVYIQACTC